jgi:hypothetical protein
VAALPKDWRFWPNNAYGSFVVGSGGVPCAAVAIHSQGGSVVLLVLSNPAAGWTAALNGFCSGLMVVDCPAVFHAALSDP